ncbi:MAG: flagellar hook-basal body complex protein, partial [Desulfarculaceae bacterium]
MGMLTAMFSGVSGLTSHGRSLSSVADNIANVNTHAYKSNRVNFGDVMVHSLTVGGNVVQQVGTGSRVLNVQNLMTQGSFESTDIPTDLAINGRGFFQVSNPNTQTGDSAGIFYTRAGQFLMDKEGYLVNPMGYRLQGYNIDANNDILPIPGDIRILTQQVDAVPTELVELSVNLNAEDTDWHHASQAIVPTDADSYNGLTPINVYDSLGVAHNVTLFFQRLERNTYTGPTPSGSVNVWKVGVFESEDGNFTTSNIGGQSTFYMHFDSDGHLVGTSTGQPAYGDQYTFGATVTSSTSEVASRAGERLSFTPTDAAGTPDAAGTQTFNSYATVTTTATGAAETFSIVVGGDTYTTAAGPLTAPQVVQDLADQINAAGGNYWAMPSNGGADITIYAKSNNASPVTVSATDGSGAAVTPTYPTLQDVQDAINNGLGAVGMIYCTGAMDIDIGADNFTGANAAALAANIDADANYNAYAIGDTVVVERAAVGTAGNLAFTDNAATAVFSGTDMMGGMDGDTEGAGHNIQASGTTQLTLARTDIGADAVISIGTNNTLGGSMGLDFNTTTQDTYAADAQTPAASETNGDVDITFNWLNAYGSTEPQDINFDFTPTSSSASTQSAGATETFYLYQDGSPRGSLLGLDIDRDGIITGQFSNGTLRT